MFGAFDEFLRELIVEGTLEGLDSAQARGRVGGVLPLGGAQPAFDALLDGSIDAAFCCIRDASALPRAIAHMRVYDEPLDLLVGPRHALAASPAFS
jgi:DNA-binding transcriptional LysR family regulator